MLMIAKEICLMRILKSQAGYVETTGTLVIVPMKVAADYIVPGGYTMYCLPWPRNLTA